MGPEGAKWGEVEWGGVGKQAGRLEGLCYHMQG